MAVSDHLSPPAAVLPCCAGEPAGTGTRRVQVSQHQRRLTGQDTVLTCLRILSVGESARTVNTDSILDQQRADRTHESISGPSA